MNTQAASDPRTTFRVLAAAINTAATLTVNYLAPSIPNELLIAWGGVFMAAVGLGEVLFDHRGGEA